MFDQCWLQFSSDLSLSRIWLFATPWITAHQASLSITNPRSSLKLMSIESMMPSSHLILCRPLLLLPPIPPSIRVFSNKSTLRITKYWSFSFNISPSNEHPGLISFRMVWLDLLSVQGTLKNLLQHHSSKASILQCSAFFTVQLSHPYRTTGKTIALTRWTFVGKVMSLFFNMLSRLIINFPPKSKHLLIPWLQSPYTVILEPPKVKSDTVSPSISHKVMGSEAMILVFWMLSFKPTFSLSSLRAEYFSVFSPFLCCCVWGGLSVCCKFFVPLYGGGSSLWVGLDKCLVKVSWLEKLASIFWWVELYLFSLECNEVSISEFWGVYGFGVTLACLYFCAQGFVPALL